MVVFNLTMWHLVQMFSAMALYRDDDLALPSHMNSYTMDKFSKDLSKYLKGSARPKITTNLTTVDFFDITLDFSTE